MPNLRGRAVSAATPVLARTYVLTWSVTALYVALSALCIHVLWLIGVLLSLTLLPVVALVALLLGGRALRLGSVPFVVGLAVVGAAFLVMRSPVHHWVWPGAALLVLPGLGALVVLRREREPDRVTR